MGATGDREVFRLNVPVVIFYVWLVFAAVNVVDLALQASPRFALIVGLVVLTITGVAYACGLRPRVIADGSGLTMAELVYSVVMALDSVELAADVELDELTGFSFGGAADEDDGHGLSGWNEIAGNDGADAITRSEYARAGIGDAAAD